MFHQQHNQSNKKYPVTRSGAPKQARDRSRKATSHPIRPRPMMRRILQLFGLTRTSSYSYSPRPTAMAACSPELDIPFRDVFLRDTDDTVSEVSESDFSDTGDREGPDYIDDFINIIMLDEDQQQVPRNTSLVSSGRSPYTASPIHPSRGSNLDQTPQDTYSWEISPSDITIADTILFLNLLMEASEVQKLHIKIVFCSRLLRKIHNYMKMGSIQGKTRDLFLLAKNYTNKELHSNLALMAKLTDDWVDMVNQQTEEFRMALRQALLEQVTDPFVEYLCTQAMRNIRRRLRAHTSRQDFSSLDEIISSMFTPVLSGIQMDRAQDDEAHEWIF